MTAYKTYITCPNLLKQKQHVRIYLILFFRFMSGLPTYNNWQSKTKDLFLPNKFVNNKQFVYTLTGKIVTFNHSIVK